MATLKHHPGMWLDDDAAAAMNALEDKYGPIIINRAGVSVAEQQAVIDRWDRGDRAGLYPPARPAWTSNHVPGLAVDVYNYTSDRAKLNEFGFEWYGPKDPVHYTFTGWTPPTINKEKDEEMFINIQGTARKRNGGAYYIADGVATFLGAAVTGLPTLSPENADALAKRVSGL